MIMLCSCGEDEMRPIDSIQVRSITRKQIIGKLFQPLAHLLRAPCTLPFGLERKWLFGVARWPALLTRQPEGDTTGSATHGPRRRSPMLRVESVPILRSGPAPRCLFSAAPQ